MLECDSFVTTLHCNEITMVNSRISLLTAMRSVLLINLHVSLFCLLNPLISNYVGERGFNKQNTEREKKS